MCSYMKHQPVRQGQIRKPGITGPTLFDKCVGSLTSSDHVEYSHCPRRRNL